METDGESDSPPFWTQSPTFFRRQPPSPIFNPVALILLIPILALLVVFFLLPPFLSHASQFLRPNAVKKSWDSINVLLVVFAILCGVFARKNEEVSASRNEDDVRGEGRGNASGSGVGFREVSGFEYSDPKVYSSAPIAVPETGISRLRRSSSSYPDLRQVPAWETEDNRFRFYDDFEVNFYRSTAAAEYDRHRDCPRWSEVERKEDEVKVIPVDTVKLRSSPPVPASPAPNPPPPWQKKLKRRRSLNSVPRKEVLNMQSNETAAVIVENRPPPPPPAPPPVREHVPEEEKPPKLQRKKSGAKNEIATAIASFYNQRKRKQRTKPRNTYETAPTSEHSPSFPHSPIPPQTPPPPPPPPPPSKVFHNLFKKSSKSKRVHSVSSNAPPPPPPPPPPPKSILNNLFKTGGKSKRFHHQSSSNPPPPPPPLPPRSSIVNSFLKAGNISRRFKSPSYASGPSPPSYYHQTPTQSPSTPPPRRPVTARKPPLPTKTPSSYYDENLNSGSQSPLIPVPPPPLQFGMPEMSFGPRGDFVRILSNHGESRCSSPELEDVDVMSVKSEQIDGEDIIVPSVCPSPDVNVKAESFIARLRDEWRMENNNSLRAKGYLG